MNTRQAQHLARVRLLRGSFAEANERLVDRLRRATDVAASSGVGGGWSAAQVGWHVAAVTNRFAGLISGDLPGLHALPDGFSERQWGDIVVAIPATLTAPAATAPPPSVTRHDAISSLEAAGIRMARAFDTITPERGTGLGISNPIVGGMISVYQIGEWAVSHTLRHDIQAERTLGVP